MLTKELVNFSFTNWTSELRGKAHGLPAYSSSSPSDFVYDDNDGCLTLKLFGQEKYTEWISKWPTFFLEVKSTSGPGKTPFHMSKAQLDFVRIFVFPATRAVLYPVSRCFRGLSTQ